MTAAKDVDLANRISDEKSPNAMRRFQFRSLKK